jgi:hypothetical protein
MGGIISKKQEKSSSYQFVSETKPSTDDYEFQEVLGEGGFGK